MSLSLSSSTASLDVCHHVSLSSPTQHHVTCPITSLSPETFQVLGPQHPAIVKRCMHQQEINAAGFFSHPEACWQTLTTLPDSRSPPLHDHLPLQYSYMETMPTTHLILEESKLKIKLPCTVLKALGIPRGHLQPVRAPPCWSWRTLRPTVSLDATVKQAIYCLCLWTSMLALCAQLCVSGNEDPEGDNLIGYDSKASNLML